MYKLDTLPYEILYIIFNYIDNLYQFSKLSKVSIRLYNFLNELYLTDIIKRTNMNEVEIKILYLLLSNNYIKTCYICHMTKNVNKMKCCGVLLCTGCERRCLSCYTENKSINIHACPICNIICSNCFIHTEDYIIADNTKKTFCKKCINKTVCGKFNEYTIYCKQCKSYVCVYDNKCICNNDYKGCIYCKFIKEIKEEKICYKCNKKNKCYVCKCNKSICYECFIKNGKEYRIHDLDYVGYLLTCNH